MTKFFFGALFAALTLMSFGTTALADIAVTPQPHRPGRPFPPPVQPYPGQPYPPQPYYPNYPNPGYPYPQPYPYYGPYVGPIMNYLPTYPTVICFAQGLGNGAMFYGIGANYYVANQWAMMACNSTGQYCQLTGCR